MRSIALANHKGGVGKTTTAIHLAHGLALAGARVVLMDLDPQGSATISLQGFADDAREPSAEAPHRSLVSITDGLWLLPTTSLPAPSAAATPAQADADRLHELAAHLATKVDWLVVDNPPRVDGWGQVGLLLSDEVIVPVQTEFLAMHGLSQMFRTLDALTAAQAGRGTLRGVLPTMVNTREPVALEVLADLRQNLGDRVFESVIFRDANLVEAASFGRTAFQHCPWSKGALCYAELTRELIDG